MVLNPARKGRGKKEIVKKADDFKGRNYPNKFSYLTLQVIFPSENLTFYRFIEDTVTKRNTFIFNKLKWLEELVCMMHIDLSKQKV